MHWSSLLFHVYIIPGWAGLSEQLFINAPKEAIICIVTQWDTLKPLFDTDSGAVHLCDDKSHNTR